MTTKRTATGRNLRRRISPEALEHFREMERLAECCTCAAEGLHRPVQLCQSCDGWWEAHGTLHRELSLKPWEWPACVSEELACPGENREVIARYRVLKAASDAAP